MEQEIIKIDYSTVLTIFKCEGVECPDKLINNFWKVVYSFFKQYEFGKVYSINGCSTLAQDLQSARIAPQFIKIFNDLGIYFDSAENELALPKFNYFVVDANFASRLYNAEVRTKQTLHDYIVGTCSNFDFKKMCYCVVDYDFHLANRNKCIKMVSEIAETFSRPMILNQYLNAVYANDLQEMNRIENISFYKRKLPHCEFVNLYKPIYQNCYSNFENIFNAINARKLLQHLVQLYYKKAKEGKEIIFYFKQVEIDLSGSLKDRRTMQDDLEQIYITFCIYLTTRYGCRCIIQSSMQRLYRSFFEAFLAQDNMYVKDYLTMLKNYPDVSVGFANNMGYFCVIDYDKLQKDDPHCRNRYRFELTVLSIKFNPETKQWLSTEIETSKYNYWDIKVLDFHDYYNLNSTVLEEAKKALAQISDLVLKFKNSLQAKDLSTKDILHQGNIILYEYDGETYLGFVSEIIRKLPFIIYPADTAYAPFKMDLDNRNGSLHMGNLQSIFSDVEWKKSLENLKSRGAKFSIKRITFTLPEYAVGIIFSGILQSYFTIKRIPDFAHASDKGVFATVDELGIWCESTRCFRKNSKPGMDSYKTLKKLLNFDVMREKNYLTFFGGLHPYNRTRISVRPEIFNYKGDRNE